MASGVPEVTAEHLADLKSAREAELVRRFAHGHPLLELEQAAISHLLPAIVLSDPPPLLVTYQREVPEYAAEIGVHKRSVYRWIDAGIAARDPVPLDRPGDILAWWARRMSRSSPEYLVKWAAKHSPTGAGGARTEVEKKSAPAEKPTPPPEERAPQRQAIELSSLQGMGLEASVQLLRQAVEANSQLLASALRNPDDSALTHYQNRYERSVEQLRKAETALFQFQKLRGDLAPKSEFRADLVTLLAGLRGMMRRRATNVTASVRTALADLKLDESVTAKILGAVHAAVVAESQRDEQLLRTARHWHVDANGEIQPEPRAA